MAKTSLETPLERTQRLGVEFWNDSCRLVELEHAAELGCSGATSNPVIVGAALEADPNTWLPFIDAQASKRSRASEEELAWDLIEEVGRVGARVLAPRHRESKGSQGLLCVQVNPKLYRDPKGMLDHGSRLAAIAPNIAVKLPATEAGLKAMEDLMAGGVPVNATVSFTVSQAVACAEAMERGRKRARADVPGYVTLMVGRIDDHLKRLLERDKPGIDPAACDWAGIAVFKAAHAVFSRRRFKSRLLVAAYRHPRHWAELIGPNVVQSIPYSWWTKFNESGLLPESTLERPVDPKLVRALLDAFPDFRRAYEEDGLAVSDFSRYGATVATLEQFIAAYHRVLDVVRRRMFAA